MPEAVNIAAIDAGSNAIRLLVARVDASGSVEKSVRRRSAVRLGHNVFTRHAFDEETLNYAVHTFKDFRRVMDTHAVTHYRAVATSATRNAYNRRVLIDRIYAQTGLELEVIDGVEEARLVRTAVLGALGPGVFPRLIIDLGGGSLEISTMRNAAFEDSFTLPVGTVRLMESFGIDGAISERDAQALARHVQEVLKERIPRQTVPLRDLAVASGGNAEALSKVAPGPHVHGVPTLDLDALDRILPKLTAANLEQRQKTWKVRRDRAEVIGIAALVLCSLGQWLNLRQLAVPGVGVREGIITDLARTLF